MPSLFFKYTTNARPLNQADAGEITFDLPVNATVGTQSELTFTVDANSVALHNVQIDLTLRDIVPNTQSGQTDPAAQQGDSGMRITNGFRFHDLVIEQDTVMKYTLKFTPANVGLKVTRYRMTADELELEASDGGTVLFIAAATGGAGAPLPR